MSLITEKDWVIYCDTNKMQLNSFANMLKHQYNFVLCQTGKEAVEKCRLNLGKTKAAILEVSLPDMSGMEVFDQIKQMSYDMPIIFITSVTSAQAELDIWRKCQPNFYIYRGTSSFAEQLKNALETVVGRFNLRLDFEKLRESQIVEEVTAKLNKQFEKHIRELKKSLI